MKTRFQCEACKKLWDSELEANECEKSHVHLSPSAENIRTLEHYYEKDRYPQEITLIPTCGESVVYKRERKNYV